ncbi:polysaccharide deacetylase family protein [Effusibacillus pohliae]|uniref:polysaccharide deacetylase family protein n=1 Tax=Effusibacillus pohliae TaxID=232270 RepID=UPI00035FD5AA|nr:polysaccharide deacetylase family protein [Effusibacillus pohliae]
MRVLTWILCGVLLLVTGGASNAYVSGHSQSVLPPARSEGPLHATDAALTAGIALPAAHAKQETVEKAVATKIPVLMYHSISDNPQNRLCLAPTRFAEQMEYLKQAGYHSISFKDLEDWKAGKPLPVKPVLITLDDGYRDNYTNAYPVLKRLHLKATVFLVTGFLNQKQFLTEEMVKEMAADGLIEFGSHTRSHADLTTLPEDRLRSEIFQSKAELETLLGTPVTAFCYPAGRLNEKTVNYVEKAGYHFAVTTRPGYAELSQGVLLLHRVRINGDLPLDQFKQMLP